jgi:hypothetical protein
MFFNKNSSTKNAINKKFDCWEPKCVKNSTSGTKCLQNAKTINITCDEIFDEAYLFDVLISGGDNLFSLTYNVEPGNKLDYTFYVPDNFCETKFIWEYQPLDPDSQSSKFTNVICLNDEEVVPLFDCKNCFEHIRCEDYPSQLPCSNQ